MSTMEGRRRLGSSKRTISVCFMCGYLYEYLGTRESGTCVAKLRAATAVWSLNPNKSRGSVQAVMRSRGFLFEC